MAGAGSAGRAETIEMSSSRMINISSRERLVAFLIVLMFGAGVILALVPYMIGIGLLPLP